MDPRRQRTQDALLDVAARAVDAGRYEDTPVEELAAEAGVAVRSLYNNFGSKAGLRAALVDRALDVDAAFMDLAYVDGRTPLEQLRAASSQYLRFAIEHPHLFRMLAFPWADGAVTEGSELATRLAQRVDDVNARLAAALVAGAETGVLRAVDPASTATLLWASWNGMISLLWRDDALVASTEEVTDLLADAVDILLDGLRTRSA
jgi:TetR/AcrR family transcriptional regulator